MKTKYRFLDHCIQNNILDQAYRIHKIIAAINNRFGNRIISDVGRTSEVVQTFRDNLHRQNLLKDLVEAEGLVRRRSYFESLDSFDGIPYLSLGELRRIAEGRYQVSEAVNYYFDTLHRFGSPQNKRCVREIDFAIYNIEIENPLLIRSCVGSRYSGGSSYFVFVLIDMSVEGRQGIKEYYCQCLVGSRTLGCCCHVMAIIWYLTWAHSTDRIRGPAEWLSGFAIEC